MAKQFHDGPKKKGMQDSTAAGDYGARSAWDAAEKPASVDEMVGKSGEFAKYKGRES